MARETVKIVNPLGLHARAAAQLVRLAGCYSSKILIKRANDSALADAKSILSLLALAASYGSSVEIETIGEDEAAAMSAIIALFENGFGEI